MTTTDAAGEIVAIPLELLYVDPRNPRAHLEPENIDELAATIEAVGLLQTPIGTRTATGVALYAGRRRLAALNRLHQQGKWDAAVPVKLVPDDDNAVALALVENTQRVALSPAAEARAFAAMLDAKRQAAAPEGAHPNALDNRAETVADIAKAFGVGARHVEQRLKLAALHPPILASLEIGAIDLDTARLWTRGNADRQAAGWRELGPDASAWQIRQFFERTTIPSNSALARYVGEARYLAAGGIVETDLFGKEGEALWLDVELATRLQNEMLEEERQRLAAEGWSDVAIVTDGGWHWHDADAGKARKPTTEEKARLKAIEQRLKAIDKEEDNPDSDWDALQEEQSRLYSERNRIRDGLVEFKPEERAKTCAILVVDEDGEVEIRRGVRKPAGRHAHDVNRDDDEGPRAGKAAKKQPTPDFSIVAHQHVTRIAGVTVGRALARKPYVALVAITAHLARSHFTHDHDEPLSLTAKRPGDAKLKDASVETAEHTWKEQLKPFWKKAGALEAELGTWSVDALTLLLAHCVGALVDAHEVHPLNPKPSRTKRERLAELGRQASCDPGLAWTPDLEVCKAMSRSALEAAAKELGIDGAAKLAKAALAARVADRAADVKWVPPIVREITGATFTPAPRTVADAEAQGESAAAAAKRKPGRPSKKADAIAPKDAPVIGGDALAAGAYGEAPAPANAKAPTPAKAKKKAVARKTPAKKAAPKKAAAKKTAAAAGAA